MKRTQILAKCSAVLALMLVPAANAITLKYEVAGPWGPVGTPFGTGPIEFVFTGVGTGTLYNPFGVAGTVVGNAANTVLGATAMNTLGTGQINPLQAIGSEDQFGVLAVVNIKDANTNAVIWSPSVKNQQLVGSFFGGTDFWGRQDATGVNPTDTTAQTGFRINLYEQTPTLPLPDFSTVTPAMRNLLGMNHLEATTPDAADFPRFTELPVGFPPPATLTLALSLQGVTGFLDASGGVGPDSIGLRANTQTQSTFVNSVGSQGNVQGFLEVTNPSIGSNAMINNNQFLALYNTAGGTVGGTFNRADARFTFTQQTLPGANPWTVNVNGPAQTLVIPEPSSVMTGIACILPIFGSAFSRRRKQVRA